MAWPREALGVRGACSRFRARRVVESAGKPGRTPNASRNSVAALPRYALLGSAVVPQIVIFLSLNLPVLIFLSSLLPIIYSENSAAIGAVRFGFDPGGSVGERIRRTEGRFLGLGFPSDPRLAQIQAGSL